MSKNQFNFCNVITFSFKIQGQASGVFSWWLKILNALFIWNPAVYMAKIELYEKLDHNQEFLLSTGKYFHIYHDIRIYFLKKSPF